MCPVFPGKVRDERTEGTLYLNAKLSELVLDGSVAGRVCIANAALTHAASVSGALPGRLPLATGV